MFNVREGGTQQERDNLTYKRLCMLKTAREAGYFDEPVIEPVPEIKADGVGPDDVPTTTATERTPPSPNLQNPAPPSVEAAEMAEHMAYMRNVINHPGPLGCCTSCLGTGEYLGDDGSYVGVCHTCKGSGLIPRRTTTPACQHRNRAHWFGGKSICLHCGEIIGRDQGLQKA